MNATNEVKANDRSEAKQEILDLLDDASNDNRLCDACEWLEQVTGETVEDAPYTEESIRASVEAEDVSLLERC